MNERIYALLKSGEARNRSEALDMAHKQLPEESEAYRAGLRMPVPTSTREHAEPHVTRCSSHPGVELLRSDPALARHYAAATPLPMASPRPRSETFVQEALADGSWF